MTQKKRKTGGRKAGTPNKATADLRRSISDLIDTNWHTVQTDLESLDGKDRLAFIEKLIAYTLPKPQSIDLQASLSARLDGLDNDQLNALIDHILTPRQ